MNCYFQGLTTGGTFTGGTLPSVQIEYRVPVTAVHSEKSTGNGTEMTLNSQIGTGTFFFMVKNAVFNSEIAFFSSKIAFFSPHY